MSFNQITLKNLKMNIKHYGMYLFSLLLSIILYFSFTTLQFTDSINNDQSLAIIRKGASVGSIFLFIMIVIFLMYANHLFIKRRTQEFALFQLIGLTRNNILRMLCVEQIAIFVITGLLGIVLGIFGSQFLLYVASKLMHLTVKLSINFEPMALALTLFLLLTAFILILFQSYLFLKKRSILALMKDRRQTETTKVKITFLEVLSGILGIVMIAFGYYIATEMFGTFKKLTFTMTSPFIILFLTVVGAYLFFRSSVSLIFKSMKHFKNGHVSITDVVFTASIMHRMKKNAMSLTVIAVISAITVTVLCFATITQENSNNTFQTMSPQDFDFSSKKQSQQFKQQLDKNHIGYSTKTYESISAETIEDKVMTLKDDSKSMSAKNVLVPNDQLKGTNAIITNTKNTPGMMQINLNKTITVEGKQQQTFKVTKEDKETMLPLDLTTNMPVIEISRAEFNKLKTNDIMQNMYGINIKDHTDMKKAAAIAKHINPEIQPRDEVKKLLDSTNGILIFVTSFLGLSFLIAAGCIIYIKQMDETEDEIDNFRILKRIGFTQMDMLKGLGLKIIFNFGLPLIIALLHALFAAIAFMKLMGNVSYTPIIVVMVVYSLVYFAFALIAFIHSNRIIKKTI
ncbi:FtsX-like permease family protein [Staphylococcus pasteuri]|uniref:FtsX-like permease family protein n=1 Tax=Staphylococcus pasteuri TaxID=45972 RepID=UPI002278070A|nr:FtsX-like permease family protein [Staphylococcus pasteuri]WAE41743.1 FtsX-like permease family protein [Staphylococcus pasteuri]